MVLKFKNYTNKLTQERKVAMKKILCTVIVFLMFITLSSCASSSHEEQNNQENQEKIGQENPITSAEVMEKINAAMDGLVSYESTNESEVIAYVGGSKLTISGDSREIVFLEGETVNYFYSSAAMSTKYAGVEIKLNTLEAFNEGKYFLSSSRGDDKSKIYSELTAKEFEDFYNERNENFSIVEGYSSVSHVKNEDGTYTVTLSDFNQENIDELNSSYGFPSEAGGGKIIAYNVTLSVGSDFLIRNVAIDYVFSNTTFSGKETVTFSNFNNAKKMLNAINPDNYNKVDDARAIFLYNSLIKDKAASNSEAFRFLFDQYVVVGKARKQNSQNDEVSYGVDNGKYYFEIDSDVNGEKNNLTYNDEVCKLNGEINSIYCSSDEEAKKIINDYFNPFGLVLINAKNVTVTEEVLGTLYNIELDNVSGTMVDFMKNIYATAGANYHSSSFHLMFLVNEDNLVSVMYRIIGDGYIVQNYQTNHIDINIEVTIEFLD